MAAPVEQMQDLQVDASAAEAKKAAKQAAQAAKKAAKEEVKEAAAAPEEARVAPVVDHHDDGQFGDLKMIQSRYKSDRVWQAIGTLDETLAGQSVWLRARIHASRSKGKNCFLVVRQGCFSVQACMFASDSIPVEMVKYTGKLPLETVVDILGEVVKTSSPIETATQSTVELSIKKIFAVSVAAPRPPFSITDATRSEADIEAAIARGEKMATVNIDTRLDNRVLDLRTPTNNSIFKLQSAVGTYFREYFLLNDFVEIHSPKIIPGVSEGGANVFKLGYFGGEACLAQSPQLYKQMSILGDLGRVFEVGPVFRAEDSNTHRHLCEFVGLDFEMEVKEHYHEVLDMLGNCFIHIFDRLNAVWGKELAIVQKQFPFEPLKYLRKTLVIHFPDAIAMLREAGVTIGDFDDFSTPQEKLLGKLVRDKFDTDFYMVDMYPLSVRPFYTMPHPDDPRYSNSYDVFVRGEEITSGAQRLHDYNLLLERAIACKIPVPSLQSYLDAFKYGALPHGGGGVGLERVVMLFLGLGNIRRSSLFPRDPKRCSP